jgi:hypothetical protein
MYMYLHVYTWHVSVNALYESICVFARFYVYYDQTARVIMLTYVYTVMYIYVYIVYILHVCVRNICIAHTCT